MTKPLSKESLLTFLQYIDTVFTEIARKHPAEVICRSGCVECCHAFFDVSFAERELIAEVLAGVHDEAEIANLRERAKKAKEVTVQFLSSGDRNRMKGTYSEKLLLAAHWRVRCPFLTDGQTCLVYNVRPATCRIYGIPTEIGGKGHVCGFSGFTPGGQYPTVKIENVRSEVARISLDLAREKGGGAEIATQHFFLYEVVEDALPLVSMLCSTSKA